jgi:DNA invertase Pin-like site-specific DNA recombinase
VNAVIYCRVSSKEQVDGTSLESQELACREYAARNQMQIVRVFIERGESAKYADRTQLLELMEFCRERKNAIDCMLVWKVDRLARNVGDHFSIKAGLLKSGIRVISVTEPIDARPEGKLLETILAGFAQFDNDIRAARTVQGLRRRVQEGLFPWYAPLGYRTATLGHKKTEPDRPVQPEFSLVQRAFQEFATGQYKKVEILDRLNTAGLRTRRGRPLSKQSLDNILSDPFYAGILHDPVNGEEIVGRHLPMVTRETFSKVQALLSRSPVAVPHKSVRPEFPLRCFVRCARCKHGLTGSFSRGRYKRYPYYHCFSRTCDERGNYPIARVHEEFREFLHDVSPDRSKLERVKCGIQSAVGLWAETSRILGEKRATEIKRLKEQQRQLIRMKMDQLVSDEEFMAQRSILATRLGELESEQAERAIDADSVAASIDAIAAPLMHLDQTWDTVPIEFQRRFQQLLLPVGYAFGSVRTAQKGHLLAFFRGSQPIESHVVPQMGQSWNQLADAIDAFAAIFRETSSPGSDAV